MRLALAKLLLGQPNLLLLDEPTNHLDLDARNWLETYLNAYPHAVILVSHDRFFLDAVVTRIADLTLRTLTDYHTNYSGYLLEHHERIEALRKAKREQDEEVARVKMFIDRFRYQATKASQVQSRIKMLEKVVPIDVPPERATIHFHFPACAKSGRTVLELKHARKAYGDLTVLADLSLHIERGDRIALVGPNGAGKSTLMRLLSAEEAPDSGERVEGHNVVMQYFAQDEATRMDPAPTVYETLASGSPNQMVAGDPQHPRRLSLLRRRCLQAGRGAVGRRTDAAGGGAHAAAAVEHAAARRADQSPRSGLEGSAARRPDRLRRHADLRLARPVFRRAAGDQDHRGRPRHRAGLSGHLRRVPVAQGASGRCRELAGRSRATGAGGAAARSTRRPAGDGAEGRRRAGRSPAAAPASRGGAARREERKRTDAEAKRRSRAEQARRASIDGWNRESPKPSGPSATSSRR